MDVKRLRKHGLRVICVVCTRETRHRFEQRLRDKRSPCCQARLIPRWHIARKHQRPGAPYKHPNLAMRARILRINEIARLRRSYEAAN